MLKCFFEVKISNEGFMHNNEELLELDQGLLDSYVQSLGFDMVRKMFDLYSQQAVIYMNDIQASLLSDNTLQWQEHCHKMKGAAGSVGLKALHARLKIMEKTTASISEKATQLTELRLHNQQALLDFNDWLTRV